MNIRRIIFRGIVSILGMCMAISLLIICQSLIRVPAVYSVSSLGLVLLACSFVFERRNVFNLDIAVHVSWAIFASWYLPERAILVLLVYSLSRLSSEISSIVFSQVDQVLGILMRLLLGSTLLTTGFVLVLGISWWQPAIVSLVIIGVLWLLLRRYDILGPEV